MFSLFFRCVFLFLFLFDPHNTVLLAWLCNFFPWNDFIPILAEYGGPRKRPRLRSTTHSRKSTTPTPYVRVVLHICACGTSWPEVEGRTESRPRLINVMRPQNMDSSSRESCGRLSYAQPAILLRFSSVGDHDFIYAVPLIFHRFPYVPADLFGTVFSCFVVVSTAQAFVLRFGFFVSLESFSLYILLA